MAGVQLRTTSRGQLIFLAGMKGAGLVKLVKANYRLNQWMDVCLTVSARGEVRLYIDRRLADAATAPGDWQVSSNALYLGSDNGLSRFFKGALGYFEFYTRAWREKEILQMHENYIQALRR